MSLLNNKSLKKKYNLNYILDISNIFKYFLFLSIPLIQSSTLYNLFFEALRVKVKFFKINVNQFKYLFNLNKFTLFGNIYVICSNSIEDYQKFLTHLNHLKIYFFHLSSFFFGMHFDFLTLMQKAQKNLTINFFIKTHNLKLLTLIKRPILKILFILKKYADIKSII